MLILKSASPRRKEILQNLGLEFIVAPSNIDEEIRNPETPLEYLKRVTIAKLNSPEISDSNIYVSSDTIVVKNEKIFPKPGSFDLCLEILQELNGKSHSVYSGIAIFEGGKVYYDYDETYIEFQDWTVTELKHYIEKQNPLDKAGGYGIQDEGTPVKKYEGSYSNVMGFPLRKFYKLIDIWYPYQNSGKDV